MEESPCQNKRLEVLRASCIGQPREMINLFFGPMRNMPTDRRIERALDRLRERYGVSGGFVTEPEVIKIRTGPKFVHTIDSLKSLNESLNTLEVFAHAHNEDEKLGGQLLLEVAGRLPDVLKRRYLDFLIQREMDLNKPGFTALRQFVVRELRIMTSEYGQGFFRSQEKENRKCTSGTNVQVHKVDTKTSAGKLGTSSNFELGYTRTRANSLQVAVRAQGDGILKNETRSATDDTSGAYEDWPRCCLHPRSKHKTEDCQSFLGMVVEDRRKIVRDKGLCYLCLGHHLARNCGAKQNCKKCQGRHSVLLHLESQPNGEDVSEDPTNLAHVNAAGIKIDRNFGESDCSASVPLMVLNAVKRKDKPETSIPFYALLDTGADSSICTKELAEELFGWKPKEKVRIQFLEETPVSFPCMKEALYLKHGDETTVKLDKVTFVDKTLPYKECIPDKEELERHNLPQKCFPVLLGKRRIDMILGAKDMRQFRLWETCSWRESLSREPLIGEHPLGPIYWGVRIHECQSQQICAAQVVNATPQYLNQVLDIVSAEHNISVAQCEQYLPTLVQDISCYYQDQLILEPNSEEMVMSKEDEMVLNFYEENLKETLNDCGHRRLELKLPWRPGYPQTVPESLHIAKRRLKSQQRKLANNPERARKYEETFEKMKAEGHAEQVKNIEQEESTSTHYITHFPTEQQKFRVVYNGALSINGRSLNDMLFRGPIFLQSLVGILVRFRQHAYAVTADIKNMFFQISLHPDDRDMLRFLPFSLDQDDDTGPWRFTVMPYGLVCVPSMAGFCIKYTASKNYANVSLDTIERVNSDFYVDDFITSVTSVEEAKRTIKEATELLATTGFVLTKFSSNCAEVLEDTAKENLAPSLKELNLAKDGLPEQKTLGMWWNAERDCLEMHAKNSTTTEANLTRRTALSYLNSYFDPLGLWSPYFVGLKLVYSEIVLETKGWDDNVQPELTEKWNEKVSGMQKLCSRTIPRLISSILGTNQLHLFSDASQYGLGACVYLRTAREDIIESALLIAKSRLFPKTKIQKFSIARKELVALCMGTNLLNQVQQYLTIPIEKAFAWTDSMTVIKWCNCSAKQLSQFVRNRVDKILGNLNGQIPNFVQTKNNPADIASRGISLKHENEWRLWTKGPHFLCLPYENWKVELGSHDNSDQCVEAEVRKELTTQPVKLNLLRTIGKSETLDQLSDSTSCMEAERRLHCLRSCFTALRKEIGWAPKAAITRDGTKSLLLKMAQMESCGKIIDKMQTKKITFEQAVQTLPKQDRSHYWTQLYRYVPFLDDQGLLRIGGRLQNSNLTYHFKHPILLPHRHWVTELYIRKTHINSGHFGPDIVFGVLQQDQGLWPIGGTGTIRHYTKDCIGCIVRRKIKGNQLMAPLPAYRLKPFTHVFACTASDFAGPFSVVVGRSTVRRWLCVFVCLTTTAIRIELVADLTTSAFLNAFRRFLCSTGFRTKFMRTDNGTNYVGANNQLKKEVQTSLAQFQSSNYAQNKMDEWEVEWEFGPPEASHHGGIYERQIRNIRKALAALPDLYTRNPTDDDLLTCCKMAEYIINCRPLTKSPSDDGLPPLRPIDLMVGALDPRKNCAPPATSSPKDELRRGHRFTRRITELWWDRWLKTYVSELQERKKWRQETRDFQVGDLVILCHEDPPRFLDYPYGVLTSVTKGTDGHVRSVVARMSDGKLKERDISKIALVASDDCID